MARTHLGAMMTHHSEDTSGLSHTVEVGRCIHHSHICKLKDYLAGTCKAAFGKGIFQTGDVFAVGVTIGHVGELRSHKRGYSRVENSFQARMINSLHYSSCTILDRMHTLYMRKSIVAVSSGVIRDSQSRSDRMTYIILYNKKFLNQPNRLSNINTLIYSQ